MDYDQIFDLLKFEPGSGMVQSILLCLILINIRSLKKMLASLETSHDKRIGTLELRAETHETRLKVLETN